ncbi:hypothetical protein PG996_013151 [Apiospora saccharicola]|uniref:Uncharacterized protein n=1 Tax=Apiospora saccharicola TaxID=335842 RepID=A0ABR1U4N8_9PEZI
MRRWHQVQRHLGRAVCQTRRSLSTVSPAPNNIERVKVKCGSSGSIHVDLHNLAKVSSSDPLMIYLPPFWDGQSELLTQLPAFCRNHPTAVINYRWAGFGPASGFGSDEGRDLSSSLAWPMPIHDTMRGYEWILENLLPRTSSKRDIYVFGSYLGASLAASVALTETHPHHKVGIRGFAAYNGIYNWTMFLRDHPIHKLPKNRSANILEDILGQPTDPGFQEMKQQAETLFTQPGGLFDPFASPCLFFHTPGLLMPPDFHSTADAEAYYGSPRETRDEFDDILAVMMGEEPEKAPRRSALTFPPKEIDLGDSTVPATAQHATDACGRPSERAHELAGLMRRSLEKLEFKDRRRWDDSFGELGEELDRRVGLRDVGLERYPFEMPAHAQAAIGDWLENRMSKYPRGFVSYPVDPEDIYGTYY